MICCGYLIDSLIIKAQHAKQKAERSLIDESNSCNK